MSNKHPRVRAAAVPPGADDLQIIDGIGPGIESRLYSAHILTYAQLANLSPDEITPLVAGIAGMSVERIIKQDWIGQAGRLVPEGSINNQQPDTITQALPQEEVQSPLQHHPYATFTIDLLLDNNNNVRRTRAKHIQVGTEDSWAGWHAARLMNFFIQQGALRLQEERSTIAVEPAAVQDEVAIASKERSTFVAEPTMVPAELTLALDSAVEELPAPHHVAASAGTIVMRDLEVSLDGKNTPSHMLRNGQAFRVALALDIADATIPSELPLTYTATLFAKKMGGKERFTVGETNGTVQAKDPAMITIECTALPQGIYRMEAAIMLSLPEEANIAPANMSSFLEGSLIQVF